MTDTRYAQLKQMLEARRRELQRAIGVKLREVRANNGHEGRLVGALDVADASNSELLQDIGISLTEMPPEGEPIDIAAVRRRERLRASSHRLGVMPIPPATIKYL